MTSRRHRLLAKFPSPVAHDLHVTQLCFLCRVGHARPGCRSSCDCRGCVRPVKCKCRRIDATCNVVVSGCSQLFAKCLRASDERAFLAVDDVWECWTLTPNTPNGIHRKLSAYQVVAVVVVSIGCMEISLLLADEDRLDGLWHCETNRCCILDLLLKAMLLPGARAYVNIITPYITKNAVEDSQNTKKDCWSPRRVITTY